jgi:voltage-gated potassium channel
MFARPQRPFASLFLCLLAAIVVRPVLNYSPIGRAAFAAGMVLFFIVAIWILCRNRRQWWTAVSLGLLWLGARLPSLINPGVPIELVGRVAEIAFLTYTVTLLVTAIFQKRTVTLDNILGAFAGYLLIALIWGIAYSLVEIADPGAFRVDAALKAEWSSPAERDWVLNYFSCCTLMTVGYGDITPVHAAARTLAVLEAMSGQLYLAVLVAVLVGTKVAHDLFPRNTDDSA